MKQTLLSIFIFIFLFQIFSCDENNSVQNNNGAVTITSLTGTVSNLADFKRNIKAYVFTQNNSALIDTQFVEADTMLNIILTPPPGTCLERADYVFPNAFLSNQSAKVNTLWLETYDDFGNFYGLLSKDNRSGENYHEEPGFFVTNAVYSDRDVDVSGNDTNVFNGVTTLSRYNITLGQGWNLVTKKVNAITNVYTEYELTSGEFPGSKWHFDYAGIAHSKKFSP